jgi:enterochelin esterase family protein
MTIAERVTGHVHPHLAALAADPSGEAAFWARMAAERTPLVERDPARPGHSLVTYVFALPEGARHVVANPGFDAGATDGLMDQVAGTTVCHATFRYRDDVRTHYSFAPDQPLASWRESDLATWTALRAFMKDFTPAPDPHHRTWSVSRAGEGKPDVIASLLELPGAPAQPLIEKREGVARGEVSRQMFESAVMGNERRVWIYTPPGYDPAARYPVLVAFDGGAALTRNHLNRVLDNLIADGRLTPLIAVLVDNATDTSRNVELPCSEDFARCLESELLPWLFARYAVSDRPQDRYVTGVSYGGLASMWLGYRLPHVFGNIIAQSPSLWWGPGIDLEKPFGQQDYDAEWLTARYTEAERLPIRIWMEIGLMEPPENMLDPNRRMRSVLEAKGYDFTYGEPPGGHDYAMWRGTLPTALEAMLGAG